MNILWLLGLLLLLPLALFAAWLAVSSCLGDNLRARLAGYQVPLDPREGAYDHNYLRTMSNSGAGLSEQIELEDMMFEPPPEDFD